MYNDYDDDNVESTSNKGGFGGFYDNNKKLVWIFLGIVIITIALVIFSKGSTPGDKTSVAIFADGEEVSTLELSKGNVVTLSAKVNGKAGKYIKWSGSNNSVAVVDDSGRVRGVSVGQAEIIAVYEDDYKASCMITVVEGDPAINVTAAALPDGDLLMGVGSQYSLNLVVKPPKGYITSHKFTSSDESIATVDDTGLVKAVGKGQAKINVSVNNGQFEDSIMVYVNDSMSSAKLSVNVQNIKFQNTIEKIEVGKITQMKFEVEPDDADLTSIVWKSSNESVVKVDEKTGALTGNAIGQALVKAYSLTGNEVASITVEVVESLVEVTSISVENASITMIAGGVTQIKPTVNPANASNKGLVYTSSDPKIAVVNTTDGGITGTINAISSGIAVITITSSNNKVATVTVVVNSSSSGDNGGGSSETVDTDRGYKISSKDATGKGIMCLHYENTSKAENIGTGPVVVTFNITSNTTSSLKVCTYKYGETACDPSDNSTVGVQEIKKNSSFNTIKLNNKGVWVVVVGEYNGTKLKNTISWYANVETATNSSGGSSVGETPKEESKVLCCYKDSSGKYDYGEVEASKCSDRTSNMPICLSKNNQPDPNVDCCYQLNGTWTFKNISESTCNSYNGQTGFTQSTCNAMNNTSAISLNYDTYNLIVNGTVQLEAYRDAILIDSSNLTWTSSNPQVATVDRNGLVTAKKVSSTPVKIRATASDGKYKECAITVENGSNGQVVINSVDYTAGDMIVVGSFLNVSIKTSSIYNRIYFCTGSCTLTKSAASTAKKLEPYGILFRGYLKPDAGVLYYYEFSHTQDKAFYFDIDPGTTLKYAVALFDGSTINTFSTVKSHYFTGDETVLYN